MGLEKWAQMRAQPIDGHLMTCGHLLKPHHNLFILSWVGSHFHVTFEVDETTTYIWPLLDLNYLVRQENRNLKCGTESWSKCQCIWSWNNVTNCNSLTSAHGLLSPPSPSIYFLQILHNTNWWIDGPSFRCWALRMGHEEILQEGPILQEI